jgi:hypothetical protein
VFFDRRSGFVYTRCMSETLKTWWLTNGVVVEVVDESIRSSVDSWTIKLAIKGAIGVKTEFVKDFEEKPEYLEILSMLLPTAYYRREIVKATVADKAISVEKAALLSIFEKNALFYFEREDFPERYVRKLYKELEKELARNTYVKEQINKKSRDR